MNNSYADRLAQAIKYNGPTFVNDAASLRRLLAGGLGQQAPEVEALMLALDSKAVAYLQKWAQHEGDKPPYDTVRGHIAAKMAQAGALSADDAAWALDAWTRALKLRPEAPRSLALEAIEPPAAESPLAALDAVAAAAAPAVPAAPAAPKAAAAHSAPSPARAPLLARMGEPLPPPEPSAMPMTAEVVPLALIEGGRARPIGQGLDWLAQGWQLFKAEPAMWIVTMLVYVIVIGVMGLVPVVGAIASLLLGPVLFAGLMLGAHAVYQGEGLTLGHLFAGFRERVGPLMLVGVTFALLTVGIVLLIAAVFGAGLMAAVASGALKGGAEARALSGFAGTVALAVLGAALLFLPLTMAYYFAPAMVAIGERGVIDSFRQSFIGCLRNVLPFLLYFIVFIVLAIIASIPAMLGWIVLLPVMFASTYAAFRDIFYEA